MFHAAENPFHASERILQNQYGIQVNRDTIPRYAERFGDEVADRHGVKIVDSTVSMNFLSLLFGVSTVEDSKLSSATNSLTRRLTVSSVHRRDYPARKGAKNLYEENMRRKQNGKQPHKWPERFTLGSS